MSVAPSELTIPAHIKEVQALIQLIGKEIRNGSLELPGGGRIDFLAGAPTHAVRGDLTGHPAIEKILLDIQSGLVPQWVSKENIEKVFTVQLSCYRLNRMLTALAANKPGAKPAPQAPPAPAAEATPKPAPAAGPAAATELVPPAEPETPAAVAEVPAPAPVPTPASVERPSRPVAVARPQTGRLVPLPAGLAPAVRADNFAALLGEIESGVIWIDTPALSGLVVLADRKLLDALAVTDQGQVEGQEALELLGGQPAAEFVVVQLPVMIAGLLPDAWRLPVRVLGLEATAVDPEQLLRAFAVPGSRGVLQVVTQDREGIAFFEEGEVAFAYTREEPAPGDSAALAELLSDPSARLTIRAGQISRPELSVPAVAAGPSEDELVQEVLGEVAIIVFEQLAAHSFRVEQLFHAAPQTLDGLQAASSQVRQMTIRMVSADKLAGIADRIDAAIAQARQQLG